LQNKELCCQSGPAASTAAASPESAWLAHFRANARLADPVPWARGAGVSEAERAAIGRAVAVFQRGESSDGGTFYRLARERGAAVGDPDLGPATRLFIAEEQRHARDLLRFMRLAGIPSLEATWSDRIFRRLRHFGGLEAMTAVLVTAEILAQVFYPALRLATRSAVLEALCERIEADEEAHVRFQCGRLARLRAGRGLLGRAATAAASWGLFWAAAVVVGLEHRSVFRAAGLSVAGYVTACAGRIRAARAIMTGTGTTADALPEVRPGLAECAALPLDRRLLGAEAELADQRDEGDAGEDLLALDVVTSPGETVQGLRAALFADRHDEAPAVDELLDERPGRVGRGGGHHDRVEGPHAGVPLRAVAGEDADVLVPQELEEVPCAVSERDVPLEAHHQTGELREERRLVPRARPDVEDAFATREPQRLEHHADHVRL